MTAQERVDAIAKWTRLRLRQDVIDAIEAAERAARNEALDAAIHALETEYGDGQPMLGITAIRALKK